jgi:hypothetical protein
MQWKNLEAGASEPENPEGPSADARSGDNHPFLSKPAMPGERLFVPQCL